jgi:hypothetical protein
LNVHTGARAAGLLPTAKATRSQRLHEPGPFGGLIFGGALAATLITGVFSGVLPGVFGLPGEFGGL